MEDEVVTYSVPYMNNSAIIYKDGPYGFWYIRLERGVCPKAFEGAFTTPFLAERMVKNYEDLKKIEKA